MLVILIEGKWPPTVKELTTMVLVTKCLKSQNNEVSCSRIKWFHPFQYDLRQQETFKELAKKELQLEDWGLVANQ